VGRRLANVIDGGIDVNEVCNFLKATPSFSTFCLSKLLVPALLTKSPSCIVTFLGS
jgi:hypothetical protein